MILGLSGIPGNILCRSKDIPLLDVSRRGTTARGAQFRVVPSDALQAARGSAFGSFQTVD